MRTRSLLVLLPLGAGIAFAACSPGGKGGAQITGEIVDLSGSALSGAVVTAGSATATTGADGTYTLSVPPGNVMVMASAPGHVDSRKGVVASADAPAFLPITLAARAPAVPLDADQGGTVTGPRGASLTAPAGAFVDAQSGAPVTGTITVALTPLDPSVPQELLAYPGQLVGQQSDGTLALLESMGVVEIDAEQSGSRLTVKPGLTLSLRLPAPAAATALASVGVWTLDDATATWAEEGTAPLDTASSTYTASIGHLSWFNLDQRAAVGCVKGRTVDCHGDRVRGVKVFSMSKDPPASDADTSDMNGLFSVASIQGRPITLEFWVLQGSLFTVDVTNGTATPAGITNANWASGYISKDDPACRPLGDIVVGSGCSDGPADAGPPASACFGLGADGGAAPDASDPWQGSCAMGLAAVFACWDPSGSCALQTSVGDGGTGGITLTYGNGARMVWQVNGATSVGTMFGPGGAVCGAMSTAGSGVTITGNGQKWGFTPTGNGETLTCPDGTTETLTTAQMQSFAGCSSASGAGGSSSCMSKPIGSCDTDADCTYAPSLSCCITRGGNMCLDATSFTACTALQNSACASDADCTGALSACCPEGLLNLCAPASCQ